MNLSWTKLSLLLFLAMQRLLEQQQMANLADINQAAASSMLAYNNPYVMASLATLGAGFSGMPPLAGLPGMAGMIGPDYQSAMAAMAGSFPAAGESLQWFLYNILSAYQKFSVISIWWSRLHSDLQIYLTRLRWFEGRCECRMPCWCIHNSPFNWRHDYALTCVVSDL